MPLFTCVQEPWLQPHMPGLFAYVIRRTSNTTEYRYASITKLVLRAQIKSGQAIYDSEDQLTTGTYQIVPRTGDSNYIQLSPRRRHVVRYSPTLKRALQCCDERQDSRVKASSSLKHSKHGSVQSSAELPIACVTSGRTAAFQKFVILPPGSVI
jgi:hypothetical protein